MTKRKIRYEKETSILSKKERRCIKLIIETAEKNWYCNKLEKVIPVEKNKNFYPDIIKKKKKDKIEWKDVDNP